MKITLTYICLLLFSISWSHPGEQNILCLEQNNYDAGIQYNHTRMIVKVPIENCTDSAITIKSIQYRTKYEDQCFTLIGRFRKINAVLQAGEKDTLLFERKRLYVFKEKLIDNSFELIFENNEHKQYINIFCELKVHEGILSSRRMELPTYHRGDRVQVNQWLVNNGAEAAEVYVNKYNQEAYFSEEGRFRLLTEFPITVPPKDSTLISYELLTQNLFKTYQDMIYLESNTDYQHGRVVLPFSGSLISEHYPSIKFDSLVMHQYILERERCEFIFEFENDGDEPLLITSCKTSCGCLVATWPKEPILPGQRSQIKIKYDSKRIGPINKSCTVKTNVSDQPIILRVKGMVKKKV